MAERKYYLAHGTSEAKVRDFFERRAAAIRTGNELAVSVGATCAVFGSRLAGVLFEGKAPDGWTEKGRTNKGERYFMPLRKSKAGKELSQRLSAVRITDGVELHSIFTNEGAHLIDTIGGSFSIQYISAEITKGKAIISVPEGMDFVPPDATPLKMSEYWAIKEAKA